MRCPEGVDCTECSNPWTWKWVCKHSVPGYGAGILRAPKLKQRQADNIVDRRIVAQVIRWVKSNPL